MKEKKPKIMGSEKSEKRTKKIFATIIAITVMVTAGLMLAVTNTTGATGTGFAKWSQPAGYGRDGD